MGRWHLYQSKRYRGSKSASSIHEICILPGSTYCYFPKRLEFQSRIHNPIYCSTKRVQIPDDLEATLESSILSHQWFTRVWVLQELVLSVEPWVQYGKARVKWDQFCEFVLPKSNGVYENTGIIGATSMNDIRKEDIDYGKSVVQLYKDTARYFINTTKSLSFLQHIESVELDDRRDGLPSWVADWTVHATYPAYISSYFAGFKDYDFPLSVPDTLVIKGFEHGRIRYLIKSPLTADSSNPQEDRSTNLSQPFNKVLKFGRFNAGSIFAKISGHDPFKEWITGFKPKHAPEICIDACKEICAEFYNEIEQYDKGGQGDAIRMAQEFNISTDDIPQKYWNLLFKFGRILGRMEGCVGKFPDSKLPVLDTGGFLIVSDKARASDSICGVSQGTTSSFIFRHTLAAESGDMELRLERDPAVRQLVKGHMEPPIKIGRYVSNVKFANSGYGNLCLYKPMTTILMALH